MQKQYEAPVLTQVGPAEEMVMGSSNSGDDLIFESESDFEFESD